MKVAMLSPIYNSRYSIEVANSVYQDEDLDISHIIVRDIKNLGRFQSELKRDGPKLLDKIYSKLILKNDYTSLTNENFHKSKTSSDKFNSIFDLGRQYRIQILQAKDHNSLEAIALLKSDPPDVIAFTGGGLIRKELLSIPRLGVLNCHSGTLPVYRGMDVVEWAILESQDQMPPIGITLHFMDRGVDTGPILKVHPINLKESDTLITIRARIERELPKVMLEGLRELAGGRIQPKVQLPEDGRQYFVMHPRIKLASDKKLSSIMVNLPK